MSGIFLGVVADDFTGASDAASFLVQAGLPTVLFNGVPEKSPRLREGTGAVVVALKTRTMPVRAAVAQSLTAFDWLKRMGAEKLYFKYCSTFDSTPAGNIGPVTDAVMEKYGYSETLLCPALPVNGRTVKDGILYVNGVPLAESPMKDHPLTPMQKSRIRELMEPQGKYRCVEIPAEKLREAVRGGLSEQWEQKNETGDKKEAGRCYYIPDYTDETDADLIAEVFSRLTFFTGGSGLAGALGRYNVRKNTPAAEETREPGMVDPAVSGKAVLLAGSCSETTLGQIADYKRKGHHLRGVLPQELADGTVSAQTLLTWLQKNPDGLIYTSQEAAALKQAESGRAEAAALIERTLSRTAVLAEESGFTRFIIAGGETSGAVTQALGYEAFYIGPGVAPGVPVMEPLSAPDVRLVLKSGNFGQPDFFERALAMTEKK